MTLAEIIQALSRTGQLPPVFYGNTPNGAAGDYQLQPERITLQSKNMPEEVLRHEYAHALQNRTVGMNPQNDVDQAIRQRLNIPASDPEIGRGLAENLAEFIGNRRLLNVDPLTSMTMRSLSNQIFSKLYRGGQ